jgi:hypothetical protein
MYLVVLLLPFGLARMSCVVVAAAIVLIVGVVVADYTVWLNKINLPPPSPPPPPSAPWCLWFVATCPDLLGSVVDLRASPLNSPLGVDLPLGAGPLSSPSFGGFSGYPALWHVCCRGTL